MSGIGGPDGDPGVSGVKDAGSSIVGDRPMLLTSVYLIYTSFIYVFERF